MSSESGNTSECSLQDIPAVPDYLKVTSVYGLVLISAGALALIVSALTFADTLRYVLRTGRAGTKSYTSFVLAIYPVICLISYTATLVPRARLLAEALTQGLFMTGMYELFCLFVAYCGGEAQLIKQTKSVRLSLKVPPLCCILCCSIVPTFEVNKKTILYLRLLVLQLPLIQGSTYFVLLVLSADAQGSYEVNFGYLQGVLAVSILLGMWGMIMTVTVLKGVVPDEFLLKQKFLVLQLILVCVQLQGAVIRALASHKVFPCNYPLTPQVYANLIYNCLIMLEMVLLGCVARKLYQRKVPEILASQRSSGISTVFGHDRKNDNNNTLSSGSDNPSYLP